MQDKQFLREMNAVLPWARLLELIGPVYAMGEGAGCSPVGLERMLRIYVLQHWFNPLDPGGGRGAAGLARDARVCRHRPWAGAGTG
jgi:hypothetical protein